MGESNLPLSSFVNEDQFELNDYLTYLFYKFYSSTSEKRTEELSNSK